MVTLWDTVSESPTVVAADVALSLEVGDLQGPVTREGEAAAWRIGRYLTHENMPLYYIRQLFRAHRLPDSDFLGEVYYRRVLRNLYRYYQLRNTQAGVDQIAEDAQIEYNHSFRVNRRGRRVGIIINIGLSPLITDNIQYLTGTTNWIRWMLPHFQNNVTVNLVIEENTSLEVSVGGVAVVTSLVHLEE